LAVDRPEYSKVGDRKPNDVLVSSENLVQLGRVLESGVGKIEPGDVLGENSNGNYEQYTNVSGTVSSDDVGIYAEVDDLESDETDDKKLNIPVTFAGVVKSGTLNHFGSNAKSDLNDDFVFV
jgi:hypothetical protein